VIRVGRTEQALTGDSHIALGPGMQGIFVPEPLRPCPGTSLGLRRGALWPQDYLLSLGRRLLARYVVQGWPRRGSAGIGEMP